MFSPPSTTKIDWKAYERLYYRERNEIPPSERKELPDKPQPKREGNRVLLEKGEEFVD